MGAKADICKLRLVKLLENYGNRVNWENIESETITALLLPFVIWILTKIAPAKRDVTIN